MVAAVSKQIRGASTETQNNSGTFFKPVIQPKLTINQPGDAYEQEADAVADKVMRMSDRSQPCFFKPAFNIQRKCVDCNNEEQGLQRKENDPETTDTSATENYLNSLNGGRGLGNTERSFFEPRLGADFSNVKVHTDAGANNSAQSLNALAYTSGKNIVFAQGQYNPDSDAGKRLLAHELTHVVQQDPAGTSVQRQTPESPAASPPDNGLSLINDDPDLRALTARSQSLLERYTAEPQRPPVPVFEAITGSVQGYTSYGRLSASIPGAWSRRNVSFTDTARGLTSQPRGRGDNENVTEGSQSTATGRSSYSPRRAIVFSAWNYATWSDVPFVREIIRAGSPFQHALQSEFGQVANVENPKGSAMRTGIQAQITALQSQLVPGRIAELMIYFEGHGGGRGICGTDDQSADSCVGFTELQGFAHTASDAGIHVTFILDSCNIGELVNLAQQEQAGAIETRMNRPGTQTSPQATIILSDVRRLLNNVLPAGHNLNAIYNLRRDLTPQNRQNIIFPLTLDIFSNLLDLYTFFEFEVENRLSHKSQLNTRLSNAQEAVTSASTHPHNNFTVYDITRLRNAIAPFIDLANVQINELLQQLDQLVPLPPQPQAPPQIVPDHDATQTQEGTIV